MRTGMSGSGFFVVIRRLVGPVASILSIVAKPAVTTVLPGARMRSYTALTSSAVNGVPSWNFTPERSVTSHTVSPAGFHAVASAGCSLRLVSQRVSVS
jgi:hypothetical protein